jgi:hypothetical protein
VSTVPANQHQADVMKNPRGRQPVKAFENACAVETSGRSLQDLRIG